MEPLTVTLRAAHAGDRSAADRAYASLYPELLVVARARLRRHQPHTLLDTQALVHESFLRFVRGDKLQIEDRRHFFAYAATMMRHIIIDHVRARQAARRGGGAQRVTLATDMGASALAQSGPDAADVLDVDRVLAELEALDATLARVVEMRYFGGCDDAEIALALNVTDRTVRRYWVKARAYMLLRLRD